MSPNRRISLNIVATYGRSLYALIIGLFCGRWALMALGESDFGLYGLIGGLIGFLSFFNNILASAIGRFYAIKVGEATTLANPEEGIDECRKWFNTALSIHIVVPVLLIVIGYPLGLWLIRGFFVIPVDKIAECVLVWRFTCVSCFVSMINVPFQAMYTAKQEIAELTIYSFITTTFNACFLYYMITHPGAWLVGYAGWMCFVGVVPQLIIAVRALVKYRECRFISGYLWDLGRYRSLFLFVIAQFWSNFSAVFGAQGQTVLVNKYMGPSFNASMTMGNGIAAHAGMLSSSMDGAFWPAITNKIGAGDSAEVKKMCFMSMRVSSVLVLVFAIPLALEMHEILRLWLVNPPEFTAEIALIVLARSVAERMTMAYGIAIFGYGKGVMKYSWSVGWAGIGTVLVAWLFFAYDFKMWSIVIGLAFSKLITVGVRLYVGRAILGFEFLYWIRTVMLPILSLTAVVCGGGFCVQLFLKESIGRIVITSFTCEILLVLMSWFFVLSDAEKAFVLKKIDPFLKWRR